MDDRGERTITVIGDRLGPRADDPLPWEELGETDAVYLTAGDPGAVRLARAARVLVSTPRGLEAIAESGVELDALVASGADRGERYETGQLDPPPRAVVRTAGAAGGAWETASASGSWDAVPLGGPVRDAYGCGDSFAAGLTYGLGAGMEIQRGARARRPLRRRLPHRPRALLGAADERLVNCDLAVLGLEREALLHPGHEAAGKVVGVQP